MHAYEDSIKECRRIISDKFKRLYGLHAHNRELLEGLVVIEKGYKEMIRLIEMHSSMLTHDDVDVSLRAIRYQLDKL